MQKAKFRDFLGSKVTQQSLLVLFSFSPLLFFRFSCLIFSSVPRHLIGFILVAKVSRKAFRILGLDERKGGWVTWNKIFMEIFRSMLHGFLPFSPVSLTELCLFWNGLKDLFTLRKLVDKFVLDS